MTFEDIPVPPPSPQEPETDAATELDLQSRAKPSSAVSNRGLYGLGRRISSRTTDLLAIVIVLFASLTMGRKMLEWWRDEPPAVMDLEALGEAGPGWGADARPVSLEFGNSPLTLTRQSLASTSQAAALDLTRQNCRRMLLAGPPPLTPPNNSERDQLQMLDKLTPDAEQPGIWALYTLTGHLPMVVGVRAVEDLTTAHTEAPTSSLAAPAKAASTGNSSSPSPATIRRVLCWGLVFPGLSPGSWTVYTFQRRSQQPDDSSRTTSATFDLSRLELPEGCQRTVLIQEAGQNGLLGFVGSDPGHVWQAQLARSLRSRGWEQPDGWSGVEGGWTGRFVRGSPSSGETSTIQIQCYQPASGPGVGLIQWFPSRNSQQESPPPASRGSE